jgi:hypothetical protein
MRLFHIDFELYEGDVHANFYDYLETIPAYIDGSDDFDEDEEGDEFYDSREVSNPSNELIKTGMLALESNLDDFKRECNSENKPELDGGHSDWYYFRYIFGKHGTLYNEGLRLFFKLDIDDLTQKEENAMCKGMCVESSDGYFSQNDQVFTHDNKEYTIIYRSMQENKKWVCSDGTSAFFTEINNSESDSKSGSKSGGGLHVVTTESGIPKMVYV